MEGSNNKHAVSLPSGGDVSNTEQHAAHHQLFISSSREVAIITILRHNRTKAMNFKVLLLVIFMCKNKDFLIKNLTIVLFFFLCIIIAICERIVTSLLGPIKLIDNQQREEHRVMTPLTSSMSYSWRRSG